MEKGGEKKNREQKNGDVLETKKERKKETEGKTGEVENTLEFCSQEKMGSA